MWSGRGLLVSVGYVTWLPCPIPPTEDGQNCRPSLCSSAEEGPQQPEELGILDQGLVGGRSRSRSSEKGSPTRYGSKPSQTEQFGDVEPNTLLISLSELLFFVKAKIGLFTWLWAMDAPLQVLFFGGCLPPYYPNDP